MGFVEDLERGNRLAAQQRAAEEESKRRAEEVREAARVQALSESSRRGQLAVKAMQGSVVPELANRLHSALRGGNEGWTRAVYEGDWTGKISLGSHDLYNWRGRPTGEYEASFISFQGIEDGSVRIGRQVLSSAEARDPRRVEQALEAAYKSPETYRGKQSYNPEEKCGQ